MTPKTRDQKRRRRGRRGNAIIEFGLCAIFMVPLYLSMVIVGLDLKRIVQGNQVARDVGHMFARWVDFSKVGNQNLVVRLAYGLNMTRTSGSGVVILSKVMKIGDQECLDGGVLVAQCTNRGSTVVMERQVIGNKSLKASQWATPEDSIINSDGSIDPVDYLKKASAVMTNFGTTLNLANGEMAFVTETWFESAVKDLPTLNSRGPVYARSIY